MAERPARGRRRALAGLVVLHARGAVGGWLVDPSCVNVADAVNGSISLGCNLAEQNVALPQHYSIRDELWAWLWLERWRNVVVAAAPKVGSSSLRTLLSHRCLAHHATNCGRGHVEPRAEPEPGDGARGPGQRDVHPAANPARAMCRCGEYRSNHDLVSWPLRMTLRVLVLRDPLERALSARADALRGTNTHYLVGRCRSEANESGVFGEDGEPIEWRSRCSLGDFIRNIEHTLWWKTRWLNVSGRIKSNQSPASEHVAPQAELVGFDHMHYHWAGLLSSTEDMALLWQGFLGSEAIHAHSAASEAPSSVSSEGAAGGVGPGLQSGVRPGRTS